MGCSANKYLTLPLISRLHLHARSLIWEQNCNPETDILEIDVDELQCFRLEMEKYEDSPENQFSPSVGRIPKCVRASDNPASHAEVKSNLFYAMLLQFE
jgi:hypothetical protein